MTRKNKILLLGKLPPPYMGPSVATEIILKSSLNDNYDIIHLDTRLNTKVETIGVPDGGKLIKNLNLYFRMLKLILTHKPDLVLIPISQTTVGFMKDSVYIILSKLFCRKVLLHLRGSNFKNWVDHSSLLNRLFVRSVLKSSQGVIVLGNKLRYIFENYFPAHKIFTVPNGGNYSIKRIAADSDGVLKIVYLANLFESKGVEDVVDACILLQSLTDSAFNLELTGEWQNEEIKKKCLEKIKSMPAKIKVQPAKAGKEKMQVLCEADIFQLLSWRDESIHFS